MEHAHTDRQSRWGCHISRRKEQCHSLFDRAYTKWVESGRCCCGSHFVSWNVYSSGGDLCTAVIQVSSQKEDSSVPFQASQATSFLSQSVNNFYQYCFQHWCSHRRRG